MKGVPKKGNILSPDIRWEKNVIKSSQIRAYVSSVISTVSGTPITIVVRYGHAK
jgi:hypothetical protein